MDDHAYLCPYSYGDANRMGHHDLWQESFHANVECARAIESSIRDHFTEDETIPDAAQPIIEQFGFKRTMRVLANTVALALPSLTISEENRAWIEGIHVPDDLTFRRYFEVDTAYGLLDSFITQARESYEMLELFGPEHCQPNSFSELDYTGRVLVMSRDTLKESYWAPEDQLWFAHDGFGCSPTARGRSIACTCLGDGERTRWNRTDFAGVLKDEFLPDWARTQMEKIMAGQEIGPITTPTGGTAPGMNMTI